MEAHAAATSELENSPTVIEGSVHTAENDDIAAQFGAAGAAILQRAAAHLQSGELLKVRELLTPIADRVAQTQWTIAHTPSTKACVQRHSLGCHAARRRFLKMH